MALVVQGLFGLAMFIAIAWACGEDRRRLLLANRRRGHSGQFVLALLLIKLPPARLLFEWLLGASVTALQDAEAGTSFVFGYLGGGPLPFEAVTPANAFVLAFQALPLILIISALTALVYYWRVLPGLVRVFLEVLERSADRRGQRDRGGGQRLYRHDRSTAVDPTLLGAARPERPLPGDELRYGNHRRHGPGALCVPLQTRSPMRRDIS